VEHFVARQQGRLLRAHALRGAGQALQGGPRGPVRRGELVVLALEGLLRGLRLGVRRGERRDVLRRGGVGGLCRDRGARRWRWGQ
jgi:hypothetical protein